MSIALGAADVQQCKERVRVGVLVILAELFLLAGLVLVFARPLGVIFTTDPEVLDLFEESRTAIALMLFFMNLAVGVECIMMALGQVKQVLYCGLVGSWLGQVRRRFRM